MELTVIDAGNPTVLEVNDTPNVIEVNDSTVSVVVDEAPDIITIDVLTGAQGPPGPSGVGSVALDDLTDVIITTASSAQLLRYNGTNWVNAAGVKSDVGLGNVDNTSDVSKPISTATQTALNLKADLNGPTFTGTVAGITAAMVGLGNVNNTSDATKFTNPSFTGTTVTLADADNIVVGTTTGTKIGTATTQKLGFFNATPVVQQAVGTDIGTVLSNLGLRASGASFADRVGNQLITAAQTLTTTSPSHNYVNSATATYNIGLPATTTAGYKFTFVKTDSTAFPVTITGTFNSGTNYVLTNQWDNVTVMSTSISGTYVVISSNRADQITGGVINTARLGSGTANSTTYLRGDSTFATLDKTAVGLANVANVDTTNAANISSGTLAIARLGASGTPSSTTFLRGDNVWATPAGGGGGTTLAALTDVTLTSPVSSNFLRYNGTAWVNYVLTKSDVALGNVVNLDTSNASNITSGTLPIGQVPTGTTGTTVALGNHTHAIYATIASPSFTGTTLTLADAQDLVLGTTTGTKIGTSTTQKVGFFGTTAVVQQAAATDLGTTLSNLGLRAAGTAYPITTSGAVSLSGSVALPAGTTGLTKTTVGLSNVDNTSDATKFTSPTFTGTTLTLADAQNIVVGSTSGTKIGTATTQKLGFFNATPVVQEAATIDLGTVLSDLGLRAAGTAYPLTTSGAVNFSGSVALPAGTTGLTKTTVGLANVANVDTSNAANISSGTLPVARLGASGVASSSTFLRGDNTWATPSGGSSSLATLTDVSLTSPVSSNFLRYNGTSWVNYALTKTDVGLSNVDNTSDVTKFTSPTLTGTIYLNGIQRNLTTSVSANTTLGNHGVVLVTTTSGAVTITLPTAASVAGVTYMIEKVTGDANAVTIATSLSQTIDGLSTRSLTLINEALTVVSDGTNWTVIAASYIHKHDASNITTGTIAAARLGSGTTTSATYLRGDSTFATLDKTAVGLGNVDNTSDATKFTNPTLTGTTLTLADAQNLVVGSTSGTKIGTATTQKIGFFNATPVVQQTATTDLGTTLSNLGLRAAGTAYPITTSGAVSLTGTVSLPAASITQTNLGTTVYATNSTASTATPAPTGDAKQNEYYVTAAAAAMTVSAPSGTAVNGNTLLMRFKDNGTARAITWNAIFRAVGVTLPTTTVISKNLYVGARYNSTDSRWDILAVGQE